MITFSMNFDFSSSIKNKVLQYLQTNNYELLGFKGVSGDGQVHAGVPTWFAVPFGNLFGKVTISYQPEYKVYVFNQAKIGACAPITMHYISSEIQLGKGLIFNQDGTFSDGGDAPPSSITLKNNRPTGICNIIVGLAGRVTLPTGQQYLPFCAFTLNSQESIEMTPQQKVLLFAAQTDLRSGNVQTRVTAPGCIFSFNDETISYDLQILDSSYEVTSQPQKKPVTPIEVGKALTQLMGGLGTVQFSADQYKGICLPVQSSVDPDPLHELFFPNAFVAKIAISEYLGQALAKMKLEQIDKVNSILEQTLNKKEVMQQIKDCFVETC